MNLDSRIFTQKKPENREFSDSGSYGPAHHVRKSEFTLRRPAHPFNAPIITPRTKYFCTNG